MNEEVKRLRARLRKESQERGRRAEIARGAGVSERTIYNLIHSEGLPHMATFDKLTAFYKKEDRKAAKV